MKLPVRRPALRRPRIFALWFSLVVACAHAHADSPLTILITASRFAETADETLAPVSVVTRADIERMQAGTVEEVLRSVPGVSVASNGGAGQVASVFLRGTNSSHVLVLVDGVKVGSATSGLTQFEHIPLAQIEKIEVVRGPRSSLYGSEAIGGVIQIFTRRGGVRESAHVGGGSHNTREFSAAIGGGGGEKNFAISASRAQTDGHDVCNAAFCAAETDEDGYDNASFSARGGISLARNFSVEANFLGSENETEFDGFYNRSEHAMRSGGARAELQSGARLHSSLSLGWAKDELQSFGGASNRFVTSRRQANLQSNFRAHARHMFTAGIDFSEDRVDGSTDYFIDSRENTGVFALWRARGEAHDFELSMRNDNNQQFGGAFTGGVAWGRQFRGGRVTASFGTAFKAPDFGSLYAPAQDFGTIFASNPNLDPEESASYDFGFSRRARGLVFGANFFRTEIKNLIASRSSVNAAGNNVSMPVNINRARIIGAELSALKRMRAWTLQGDFTWQRAQDRSVGNSPAPLLKRPKRKVNFDISRESGRHLFGVNVHAQDASLDFAQARIAAFTVLGARYAFRFAKQWTLQTKVNNFLDEEYETAAGYPQDSTNFLVTLRYATSR